MLRFPHFSFSGQIFNRPIKAGTKSIQLLLKSQGLDMVWKQSRFREKSTKTQSSHGSHRRHRVPKKRAVRVSDSEKISNFFLYVASFYRQVCMYHLPMRGFMSGKKRVWTGGSLGRLADLVNEAGIRLKPNNERFFPQVQQAKEFEPVPSKAPSELTENELFMNAMDGVHRVAWRHDPLPSSQPVPMPEGEPDVEGQRLMQAAIEGNPPMAVLDHPEYIEGWIGATGKRFLPKLRNGLYSIQGQIDLHGLSRAEAQIAVEDYIIRMSRFHSCCVKIIHGRGINSPTDRATLKEDLQHLLSTRRMSRYVVAYASAPLCDGGVGAVYVLLHRQ
jgi:DNA-nicking Smr family endonuclease